MASPHRKTSEKRRSGQFGSERGVEMDTNVLSTKRLFKAEIPHRFADSRGPRRKCHATSLRWPAQPRQWHS